MYNPSYQTVNPLTIIVFVVFFSLVGCTSARFPNFADKTKATPFYNSFHGLVVVDAASQKEIYNHNADKYFTPASNVKIVTLFTGLQLLPEHAPSLKYLSKNDTLYFEGTGDPSQLHPYFKDSTAINFLKQHKVLYWYPNNSIENRYGPGWAWEDFDTYFSPEKSALPLYGNVVNVWKNPVVNASPDIFKDKFIPVRQRFKRAEYQNEFYVGAKYSDTLEIPFIVNATVTQQLLQSATGRKVSSIPEFPVGPKQTLNGLTMDSIYKRMMHKSDNFLAEQILMMASSTLSDTLSTKNAIAHVLENHLKYLENQPRWVDGSGLSRYNLFTPKSFVQVLQKIHAQIPEDRLFQLFPLWDATGTIDIWEHPGTEPFIFAKSGSLGNNYNLSGYLKTKSGKLFIFSFMNNHFQISSQKIREEMFEALMTLHEKY